MLWSHKWKSPRSCDNPTPCLCSHILTDMCVLIFRDIFPECRRKRGAEQQLSLSWLSSPLTLLLLPTQPEPPHSVTDCPSAGHQLTLSPSVQRQILRRDTFLRKHRDTRRRKRQKEKKQKEQKEVVVVTCDKWEYLLHTGIYLFYSSSLSFNKTSLIEPFWQSYSIIGQIKLIVKYPLSKHKKLGCVSPFAWS